MSRVPRCSEILTILKPLQNYLKQEYQDQLNQVILFGSQARGDATLASDIDILIVLQELTDPSAELERTSEFTAQFCLEHSILVSRFFISQLRFETENSPLLRNIRQEGIAL